jgi:thiamine biosynthesis lipoprotein
MRILLVIVSLLAVSCAEAGPLELRGATMGTTYHIKFAAAPQTLDLKQLRGDVEEVLAVVDRQMSTYRADSELSRFNRAPAGQWYAVSAATAEVAAAAQSISEKSQGALDVTVGPLVKLWHFGPPGNEVPGGEIDFRPPADTLLSAVRKRVGYRHFDVRTDPPALRKNIDGLEVDLSSIAPGYAIDRLAQLLATHGIENFMVELGGEIRAAGQRADGKPWRVGIRWPVAGPSEMRSIPLINAAVATAGDYEKYFVHQGRRYSHVIDPASGRPIDHALASVTVVAESCMAADGWDTPLLVLGPLRGFECAERHGIAALFIARGEEGASVRATPAWQAMFDHD